jgi:predicted amidophosphoribosyltransferase
MPGIVDSVRQKADQAALEADKLIRIRREQAATDQMRRDISTQMDALGQAALAAYRAGEIAHPRLLTVCQAIDALNEQIGQREARIEQIRVEKLATPSPQSGITCPNCKQLIAADAAFCSACGYRIPKPPPAEPCPSCGSPIPAAAQFCPSCGQRKAPAPKTIRCVGCGAELPAIAVFCPDCGTRVGAAGAAVVAAPPVAPAPAREVSAPVSAAAIPESPPTVAEVAAPVAVAAAIPESPPTVAEVAIPEEPTVREAPEPQPVVEEDKIVEAAARAQTEALPALTKRCPACQAELPMEAIFCPDCGARQPGA